MKAQGISVAYAKKYELPLIGNDWRWFWRFVFLGYVLSCSNQYGNKESRPFSGPPSVGTLGRSLLGRKLSEVPYLHICLLVSWIYEAPIVESEMHVTTVLRFHPKE